MAKKFRRGRASSFPKRSTLWLPFETTIALTTAGASVESGDILGNYFGQTGEEVPIGSTIGPVRGRYGLTPTVESVFDENNRVESVLQLNREGGRATLPVPGVDIGDFMWYGQAWAQNGWEVGSGVFEASPVVMPCETKAKRKISGNGQTLTFSATQNTNVDYTLTFLGTVLIMLP